MFIHFTEVFEVFRVKHDSKNRLSSEFKETKKLIILHRLKKCRSQKGNVLTTKLNNNQT